MTTHRFKSRGTYLALGVRGGLIGEFEAKRACTRDETAPCGEWRKQEGPLGVSYLAMGNGCEVVLGRDHPRAEKFSPEEVDRATSRFRWRESMR